MVTDKRAKPLSGSLTYNLMTFTAAFTLTGALVLVGCDSNDVTEPEVEIAAIVISPDSVSMEVGESVDFSIVALTAAGDTVPDADLDIEWWSTDTEVFTVEPGGVATGQAPGSAFCMVEATNETASNLEASGKMANSTSLLRFTGRDSAFVRVLF